MALYRKYVHQRAWAAVVAALLALAAPAHATSITSSLSSAVVDPGRTTIEGRAGAFDDNRWQTLRVRQHVDHAFDDSFALRLTQVQEDTIGGGLRSRSTALDLRWQIIEKARDGFDAGLRATYTVGRAGEPEGLDIRAMAEGELPSAWRWRGNIILKQDIGAGAQSGASKVEVRGSLSREAPSPVRFATLRLGIEAFSELGQWGDFGAFDDQDHQIGVSARFTTAADVSLQLNLRAGLSEAAPDHGVSMFVSKSF